MCAVLKVHWVHGAYWHYFNWAVYCYVKWSKYTGLKVPGLYKPAPA